MKKYALPTRNKMKDGSQKNIIKWKNEEKSGIRLHFITMDTGYRQ